MSFYLSALEGSPSSLIWQTPYQDGVRNVRLALDRQARLSPCERYGCLVGGLGQCIPFLNTAVYGAIRWVYSPNFWASRTPSWMQPGEWQIDLTDVSENRNISSNNVRKLLDQCEIPYLNIPPTAWKLRLEPPVQIPMPRFVLTGKAVLWSNRAVQIDTFHIGSEYHLFARLRVKRSFVQLTGGEMLPLRRTIDQMSRAFALAYGSSHYTESLVEDGEEWAIELFPAGNFGASRPEQMNVHAKIQRSLYIISQGQMGEASLTYAAMRNLTRYLVEVMESSFETPDRNDRSESITSHWVNNGQAAVSVMKNLLHSWRQAGLRVRHVPHFQRQTIPNMPRVPRTIHKCAFCIDEVIQRQTLVEEEWGRILFSHLPYVGREGIESSHFLVVPKHHVEDSAASSDAELIEEHEMLVKIKVIMAYQRSDCSHRIWSQHGLKSGETVPHRHFHVLVYRNGQMPEYLEQVALEIAGNPVEPVAQPSPEFVHEYLSNT